ncbi:MAG TPA: 16S rRNA (cytosine(1402)-N(4))-methyltransferase RsmH [Candidatus Paceibacterota bacterium]
MHKTVLLNETLKCADIQPTDIVFEGTGGEGGLSKRIVSMLGPAGTLIITELDQSLVANLRKNLTWGVCSIYVKRANFKNIKSIVRNLGYQAIDVIILDLGVANFHYEESGRGFSFNKNEPLLMTLGDMETNVISARDAVNTWSETNLSQIFEGLGGERHARQIAKAIIIARQEKQIETTVDLIRIIEKVLDGKRGAIHPATKIFQALRIAVNDEIGALKQVLRNGWTCLRPGGRFIVISFHEVEDREVKIWFKSLVSDKVASLINKKPIKPTLNEIKTNRRSRSALLRAMKKNKASIYE